MAEHDCAKTIASLLDHLEHGTDLPATLEGELRGCTSCGEMTRRAHRLGALLETHDTSAPDAADDDRVSAVVISEVARRRRTGVLWTASAVLIATAGYAFYAATHAKLHHPVAVGILLAVTLGTPMLLLIVSIRSTSPGKVFKRLEGRQLSGVCQGLSESLQISPWILRTVFIALIFLKGAGLVLYLLLDVALPIHPADRSNLWRFRFARWWKTHVS